jgi:hypothetical protein
MMTVESHDVGEPEIQDIYAQTSADAGKELVILPHAIRRFMAGEYSEQDMLIVMREVVRRVLGEEYDPVEGE